MLLVVLPTADNAFDLHTRLLDRYPASALAIVRTRYERGRAVRNGVTITGGPYGENGEEIPGSVVDPMSSSYERDVILNSAKQVVYADRTDEWQRVAVRIVDAARDGAGFELVESSLLRPSEGAVEFLLERS